MVGLLKVKMKPKITNENKFAYITNARISVRNDHYGNLCQDYDYMKFNEWRVYDMSIDITTDDQAIADEFFKTKGNILNALRVVDEEYICIWCNSPNPIVHRHCSRCGAPRGFIIR